MPFFYYYDPTYILVLIGAVLSLWASATVKSTYNKYSRVYSYSGLTGAQAAAQILRQAGIYDVRIEHVSGNLTDHYDPKARVLRLSDSVYGSNSVAAIGVAAHECGHAIQDKENYTFMRIRSALVPFVNFVTYLGYLSLIISLIAGITGYLIVGILILLATLLFQIVTLPVEFDASNRAQKQLISLQLVDKEEQNGVHNMLRAAAMTYVASVISTLLNLLRLIIMFNDRDN